MKNLQSTFMGGAYIIGILLLANLIETFIAIPKTWNPFVSSDWITLLWHSGTAVLLATITGYLAGLLAQFFFMLDDGAFDAEEKKQAYMYAYSAFFGSMGILLAANLFGQDEFNTAMIFNIVLTIIMALLVYVLPKVFGKGIDQGGTASLGLHHHTNQPPTQPTTNTTTTQNNNNANGVKMPAWAIALIGLFVIMILARIFGTGQQNGIPNKQNGVVIQQSGQPATQLQQLGGASTTTVTQQPVANAPAPQQQAPAQQNDPNYSPLLGH